MTVSSLSRAWGSFASNQGSLSTMYLFVVLIKFQMEINALWKASLGKDDSVSDRVSPAVSMRTLSSSEGAWATGTFPSQYFTAIVKVLLTRFPRSFARSELSLWTKLSSLKFESRPKTMSLSRKYLNASRPYLSFISKGFTTVPLLLDILPSSIFHQPCTFKCLNSSIPAAFSIVGQ